jgi:hypothetical protein
VKIDAPLAAADVKKPDRSEWPEKVVASKPTSSAYEVLQVITSSPGELEPVFESMLANATRICGANFGRMDLYEEGSFRPVAHYNVPAAYAASLASTSFKPHPQGVSALLNGPAR